MVTEDGPCELKSSGAQAGSLENVGRGRPLVWIMRADVPLSLLESPIVCVIVDLMRQDFGSMPSSLSLRGGRKEHRPVAEQTRGSSRDVLSLTLSTAAPEIDGKTAKFRHLAHESLAVCPSALQDGIYSNLDEILKHRKTATASGAPALDNLFLILLCP